MPFTMPSLTPAIPEIVVLIMACITLLTGVFTRIRILSYLLAQLTLIIVAILTYQQFGGPTEITFSGSFILDKVAIILKLSIYVATFLTFAYSRHYVKEKGMPETEYYVLGLFSVLGMMVLVSAYSFLTLFLGLELFSLPVYAMVALRRDSSICSEAAIKYFVIGAMATGILLYGLSMLYGATESIDIPTVAQAIANSSSPHRMILVFGLVFVMVGLAFKFGAVPFHMWVPDVYEGAPASVTLFIGTAPKLAALALAYRLLVDAMPDLSMQWQQILIVVAILSMGLGNLAAIAQTNIRRMLAYSSIAHMGFMLLGILTITTRGYAASMFYMITYVLMTLGAFGLITMLSRQGIEIENIDDFKGLNSRNPWLAFIMLLLMFSMAGVPPLVGFMAKIGVIEALINVNLVWLAVVAILFAVIGVYYYIRMVKVMYFEEPETTTPIATTVDMQVAISVNGILVLVLGIFPGTLFSLCHSVF